MRRLPCLPIGYAMPDTSCRAPFDKINKNGDIGNFTRWWEWDPSSRPWYTNSVRPSHLTWKRTLCRQLTPAKTLLQDTPAAPVLLLYVWHGCRAITMPSWRRHRLFLRLAHASFPFAFFFRWRSTQSPRSGARGRLCARPPFSYWFPWRALQDSIAF